MACTIIDSHVHLYTTGHLPRLNWSADLPRDHILNRQHSVDDYKQAIKDKQRCVRGFIFVETDRKYGLDESGWVDPLEEVDFLVRIATGQPVAGEGFQSYDNHLVLGIVPWAPIAVGPAKLKQYIAMVRQVCNKNRNQNNDINNDNDKILPLIKGFRYLLQDKPRQTMTSPEFVSALQWLGTQGFTFDLGIDARSGGMWQLYEACNLLDTIYLDGSELRVIVNHFCKPNLRLTAIDGAVADSSDFMEWRRCIGRLASHPNVYMKLSGFFSELPEQDQSSPTPLMELVGHVGIWTDVVLDAFGPSRIMFGSDWPVCTAAGLGSLSWQRWHDLVEVLLDARGLNESEKQRIWSGTAVEAYHVDLS